MLDNVEFKQVDEVANSELVAPFQENEIRAVVWDCEGSKSPGPDGVNFGFIKEFWELVKTDFVPFFDGISETW